MLNARSIQSIIALALGMFLAIWLGMAIVTDQFETLLKIGGGAFLLTAVFLGRRIWLMFIFLSSMNVMLYRWFGTIEIGQVIFMAFAGLLFLMRRLRFKINLGELELWTLLIVLCIVQAYMRFPVGLNVLGSGNVGGRPYIVLALCISSAFILSTLRVPPQELKWAMRLAILGGFLGIPAQLLRFGTLSGGEEGYSRIPSFAAASALIARWLSSHMSPLRACLHPLWLLVVLISLALAAGSGYRNAIAAVGLIYIIGIFYHSGWSAVLGSFLIGAFFLLFLALINLNYPLPGNIQRALSPFPGTWEERYIDDTDRSTKWRVEMWEEALFTDYWIKNKVMGDGIGLSGDQLQRQVNLRGGGGGVSAGGLNEQQVTMLELGSFHSGPVHSIRMTGYVGLLVLLAAMIRLAAHAHRQIIRCRGTEWFPLALFFGIPLISQPIYFTFIFGEYHTAVAQTMLGIAMVRLMEHNIPLPAWKNQVRLPYILKAKNVTTATSAGAT